MNTKNKDSYTSGLYLDFLDSAKSAHVEQYANDWWRPDSVIDQNNSIEFARAEMMVRILHGDTIVLSNNQVTDSVAWLSLADQFSKISLPWEPISIAFFNISPSSPSQAIKAIIVGYFSDPNFVSSAWVGLDKKLKELVLKNITKSDEPMFHRMLYGVTKSIGDADLAQALEVQAIGLQSFYEYLINNSHRLVSFRAGTIGSHIWPKLEALKNRDRGIPERVLTHIKTKLSFERMEHRGSLYEAIGDLDITEREDVRKYIDFFYNEKMGLSVSQGKGVYTITDHDKLTSPVEDERMVNLADSTNSTVGLLGNNVLQIRSERFKDYLTWEDFLDLVSLPEFQRRANFLRRMIEEYDTLDLTGEGHFKNYNSWLGKTFDALNKHQDYLAEQLGRRAVRGVNGFVLKIGPWLGAGAGAIVGSVLGNSLAYGLAGAIGANAGGTILSEMVSDLLKEKGLPKLLASNAAGKIRAALEGSVSIKSDEELLKK